MKQQAFEQAHMALWRDYRALLDALEQRGPVSRRLPPTLRVERLPRLLRLVGSHYALARSRGYSPGLVSELQALVQRGYHQLHRPRPRWPRQVRAFVLGGFPRAVRRHALALGLASALFFGPMLAMGVACALDAALIYSLLGAEDVTAMESMYDPANARLGADAERQADGDVAMFGFYVRNNVGVAFRTFASGLLFGLGSLFFLGFNGLYIGAVAGHLSGIGMGTPFWSFVSGHSALELTAIAIAGAAGLLLAQALIAPGRYRRVAALRRQATAAVPLITGAMLMLVLAAVVEAFWSSQSGIAPGLKYTVGFIGWGLVVAYLGLAGRAGDPASGPVAGRRRPAIESPTGDADGP